MPDRRYKYLKVEDRIEWFNEHDPDTYPILVVEMDNTIAGWISISPYRKGREGLKYTAEVSYYVHRNYQRKGAGTEMMDCMIRKAKELKYKTLIAILMDVNSGNIKLLEKYHFKKWGFLPDVIEIDGIVFSHLYYGLKI
jgi:L-amino acid N-acyltransferase YncA